MLKLLLQSVEAKIDNLLTYRKILTFKTKKNYIELIKESLKIRETLTLRIKIKRLQICTYLIIN